MDETVAALATCKQDQRKKTETQSLLTSAHSPVLQAEKKKNESSSGDQTWAYPEPALLQKQHPAGSPMLLPSSGGFQDGLQRSSPWDSRPCGLPSLNQGWFVWLVAHGSDCHFWD